MKIHKEGYKIIAVISIISFITAVCMTILLINNASILIPVLILILLFIFFVLHFFRIPDRENNYKEGVFYSPADGKIVAIEEIMEDEFLKEKRIQVSIFMSVWDVHINYYPVNGRILNYKYHPGKFLIARHPKSSTLNERTTIVLENDDKIQILLRQIAGIIARRIVCYARIGTRFTTGEELGFIKFGSRVDIFLPLNSRILVKMNDQVYGGLTPLALL